MLGAEPRANLRLIVRRSFTRLIVCPHFYPEPRDYSLSLSLSRRLVLDPISIPLHLDCRPTRRRFPLNSIPRGYPISAARIRYYFARCTTAKPNKRVPSIGTRNTTCSVQHTRVITGEGEVRIDGERDDARVAKSANNTPNKWDRNTFRTGKIHVANHFLRRVHMAGWRRVYRENDVSRHNARRFDRISCIFLGTASNH